MYRVWTKQMNLVRRGKKSRVVAQRDFRRKFGYMSGDFRAEAYYAESVDLIRKLMMSGLLSLIRPGTVFQSFCSVVISLTFVALHIKIWPVRPRQSPRGLPAGSSHVSTVCPVPVHRGQPAQDVHRRGAVPRDARWARDAHQRFRARQ